MTVTCETFRELIFDAAGGGLKGETLAKFQRHAAACGSCTQVQHAVERQAALIKALPHPTAPSTLWGRIEDGLRDRDILRRYAPSPFMKWTAVAAALTLAILGVVTLARAGAPRTPMLVIEVEEIQWNGTLGRMMPGYENPRPAPPLMDEVLALNR